MLAKLLGSRGLLQTSIVVIAILICDGRCFGNGFSLQTSNFNGAQTFRLTFTTKNNWSIVVSFKETGNWKIRVQATNDFWDIETEEGKKLLSEYLDEKSQILLDTVAKQRQLTPEQLAKLTVAARIQVARDCRTVHELASSSVMTIRENPVFGAQQMRNDELGLMRISAQLSDLFEDGIGRKDSLFTKVLNYLQ